MVDINDLIGEIINNLKVNKYLGKDGQHHTYECKCLSCGQISKQRGLNLRKGIVGCKCSTHIHIIEYEL